MYASLTCGARALLLAGVLCTTAAVTTSAQRGDGAPTNVTVPLDWDGIDGDAIRISYTAEGQLFVRVVGSRRANLLVDRSDGQTFAAALRSYTQRVQAAGNCDAQDRDAMPRLAAKRVHVSGIGGIAIGCDADGQGSETRYVLHVTRPSAVDGPPVEALPLPLGSAEMRSFVDRLERLVARQR